MDETAVTVSRSRSTSTTSSRRCGSAALLRAVVRRGQGGLELYSAAGPEAIGALAALGYEVFCDLKLHDIPTTVGQAARVLGSLGRRPTSRSTQRAARSCCAPASRACAEGAAAAGLARAHRAGRHHAHERRRRARRTSSPSGSAAAVEAGCGGIVCAAADVPRPSDSAPRLLAVVPGIRPRACPPTTRPTPRRPRRRIDAGADLLVIGRAVTQPRTRRRRGGRRRAGATHV